MLKPRFAHAASLRALALVGLAGLSATASAQNMTPPEGVVSLASSASVEVTKDVLAVALSASREGQDAASVQSQLKQALEAALVEARRAARPGQVEVQAGNFSLYPRYSNKGTVTGWMGSTELLIEGRDMQAIGQLTGRITTMTIARVGYNLSREVREKVEGDVTAQAIARYRAKAADYAKQFGYAGYTLREVSVQSGETQVFAPAQMMRAKTMAMAADESLPTEPGKGMVSVTVNGTVQLTK
jgi:predicted secreted protein